MLVADFKDAFGSEQRAFHISKFEVDRINGSVRVNVGIYSTIDRRNRMKAAIEKVRALQKEDLDKSNEVTKAAYEFSKLTPLLQQSKQNELDKLIQEASELIEENAKKIIEANTEANDHAANATAIFVIPSNSIDIEKLTVGDLYRALTAQLSGVVEGEV